MVFELEMFCFQFSMLDVLDKYMEMITPISFNTNAHIENGFCRS